MSTPNMGLALPTDHDSADVWGVILDTVFNKIDAHTHAAGDGAQINLSSLAIDADISFVDAGGGKHAITDLKAIDFFPSPAAAMVGFAGAFFVSDGTGGLAANELYFRSVLGTNIKVTDGGTLNVAAFTGSIGGDYAGVGALESFVDSSDAYLFQQQVGASVRQFAKMQCADLSLFEFKAVGATPIPSFGVTLKSPAALAASYTLTLPGALPSIKGMVQIDSTGLVSVSGTTWTIAPEDGVGAGGSFAQYSDATSSVLATWVFNNSYVRFPLRLPVGSVISAWSMNFRKNSTSASSVSAKLCEQDNAGNLSQIGATQTNSANSPGVIALGQSGLAAPVVAGHSYVIIASSPSVSGLSDSVSNGSVTT